MGEEERLVVGQSIVKDMLIHIGEDPTRPGLLETPLRVSRMWEEIYRGYHEEPPALKIFDNGNDGVKYHDMLTDESYFFSYCEHHMVPFFGQYFFGYIPGDRILGLSKISRTVDYFSARLQIAERLVHDIADYFEEQLQPRGLILVMRARHLCKEMRGAKKWDSPSEARAVRGCFEINLNGCKDEFYSRLGAK